MDGFRDREADGTTCNFLRILGIVPYGLDAQAFRGGAEYSEPGRVVVGFGGKQWWVRYVGGHHSTTGKIETSDLRQQRQRTLINGQLIARPPAPINGHKRDLIRC